MALETVLVTAEEFKQIANDADGLVELVRGEVRPLNRPSFNHGYVCSNIGGELRNWSRQQKTGRAVSNDLGVVTHRDPDSVRGPDVAWISYARLPKTEWPGGWLEVPPEVCIEVLSPSDRWGQTLDKINEYLQGGVNEVWIADPELRQLQVFRADVSPRILQVNDQLTSKELPGFAVAVDVLFEGM